jgi:PAS domain S-box-containing protein
MSDMHILESVIEAAGDGLMDWDFLSGKISYSARWKAILGYEPGELEDSPSLMLELTHPDDRAEVDKKLIEHLDAMWPFTHTWRLGHKDGSWRWLLARAVSLRNDDGQLQRILIVFSDISDRVMAERRMAALFAAVPDFIVRLKQNGALLDANLPVDAPDRCPPPPGLDIFAWEPTKSFAAPLMEVVQRVALTSRAERCDMRTESGREFEAHVASSGEDEAVCVIRDITARRQMEAQVHQSQRLESIGQLAAGIAHEINTPIQFVSDSFYFLREAIDGFRAVIKAYKNLAAQATDFPALHEATEAARQSEDQHDFAFIDENVIPSLDRASDGLQRVTTIVRSMKEFAHPGQNQRSSIDLNHAIETTLTIARNEYKYVADVATEFGDLPAVSCFPGELNQVVLNILVNAAHAIGDVVGATGERGLITLKTYVEEDQAVVAISDTGGGIPAAIQDRIFDPFFTTKEVGKGTGQGLALARSTIVQKHHGTLSFKTTVGVGTTFFIKIPINAPA